MKYTIEITNLSFKYNNNEILFTYKYGRKLKRTYIDINNKKDVIVKTPISEIFEVKKILQKKGKWILKKLGDFEKKPYNENLEFNEGSFIPYLGDEYKIKIVYSKKVNKINIAFKNDIFIFTENPNLKKKKRIEYIENELNSFYKKSAKEIITPLIEKWSKQMELYPQKISFRKAKKRWSNLNSKDYLSVNYYLIKKPIKFIEYVIVHELAHIQEKNHSKKFWQIIEKYIPDYKQIKKEYIGEIKI